MMKNKTPGKLGTPANAKKSLIKKIKQRNYFPFLIPILAIVFLDQFTKHLIKENFYIGSSKEIIHSILSFTYVQNTGVSFGLFKGMNALFIAISFIALGFFIYLYLNNERYKNQLAFVCGGLLGNLMDRISLGSVVDFIDFHFWPIFNIADSAICIGIVWLIFSLIINKEDLL
jgi:signal peptidase II